MKKLVLSAFAMSLCLLNGALYGQSRDFLGLESELLPLLPDDGRFTKPNFHQEESWNVREQEVIQISSPLKGQNHSTITWKNLDPEKWMDFDIWKNERNIKDQLSDWQLRIRQQSQNEHVGKVLQCKGDCQNFRGSNSVPAIYQSRIDEGDEFHTSKNSAAWIYLLDGSLVRIGPDSSVTFQEINLSNNEILVYLRLNQGHLYWHPRLNLQNDDASLPETDIFTLPLQVKEANQEYFERKLFNSQNDNQHLADTLNLNKTAIQIQLKELQDLREKNNSNPLPTTRVIAVSPQVSVISKKAAFDFLYLTGNKTYFKKRSLNEGDEFQISLRGYTNTDLVTIRDLKWYSMHKDGRSYDLLEDAPVELQLIELLTSRIKSIELAREYWFEKYSSVLSPLIMDKNAKDLGRRFGYVLWAEDYQKRIDFLMEYSRRVETTYLKALENLSAKLEAKGEKMSHQLDSRFHEAALNSYLSYLKRRYSLKYTQVREMNDLQYYIWVLKQGAGILK